LSNSSCAIRLASSRRLCERSIIARYNSASFGKRPYKSCSDTYRNPCS
jgi:hypothetical protein